MRSPGFLTELQNQLELLDISYLETVNREGGLEVSDLIGHLIKPVDHTVYNPLAVDTSDYIRMSDTESDSFWKGKESLSSGDTLYVLITTPECFRKKDKCISSLESHLIKASWVKRTLLLVNPADRSAAFEIISNLGRSNVGVLDGFVTFLLTPDNRLDTSGEACHLTSCGQGDLINSLKQEVKDFKYVYAANACEDSDINPTLVGQHIYSDKLVTCELTAKSTRDLKPIFCNHSGFSQLVESYRFSHESDKDLFTMVGSEQYVFSSQVIKDDICWKWHRRKIVKDGRMVVKFERTLCNLTSHYQTQFILTQA